MSPQLPGSASPAILSGEERETYRRLATASHGLITGYQHESGAYPASPDFSAYVGYAWLRDGAFTAEGISRYGDVESADRFHDWAAGVLGSRRDQVDSLVARAASGDDPDSAEMLPTRFTLEGEDGSDPWWNFQLDGYGIWLWSVVAHAERHAADLDRWRTGIEVAVDYLLAFWDRPCYDWWEEHLEHRHVSTLASVYGGLWAVSRSGSLSASRQVAVRATCRVVRGLVLADGVADGHLVKWLGSVDVDGSLPAAVVPFGLVDGQVAARTLDAVARDLDHDGGIHRFRADVFYGGGQWLILSALLGWNLAAAGDRAGALGRLRWIAAQADEELRLPEQVSDHLLHPEHRDRWIERWGPVANPLLWSHGMYLILADELGLTSGEM